MPSATPQKCVSACVSNQDIYWNKPVSRPLLAVCGNSRQSAVSPGQPHACPPVPPCLRQPLLAEPPGGASHVEELQICEQEPGLIAPASKTHGQHTGRCKGSLTGSVGIDFKCVCTVIDSTWISDVVGTINTHLLQ